MTRARPETLRRGETEPAGAPAPAGDLQSLLTPKEQACLRLVAQHQSSKEIAQALGIAKTSVDTYCDRARTKLGVADRYEAARRLMAELGPVADPVAPPQRPVAAQGMPGPAVAATLVLQAPGPWAVVGLAVAAVVALATLLSGLHAIGEATRPMVAAHAAR